MQFKVNAAWEAKDHFPDSQRDHCLGAAVSARADDGEVRLFDLRHGMVALQFLQPGVLLDVHHRPEESKETIVYKAMLDLDYALGKRHFLTKKRKKAPIRQAQDLAIFFASSYNYIKANSRGCTGRPSP